MGLCQPAQHLNPLERVGDQPEQRRLVSQVQRPPFRNPAPEVGVIGAGLQAKAMLDNDGADLGPKFSGGSNSTPATAPFRRMEKLVYASRPPGPLIEEAPGMGYLNPVQRWATIAWFVTDLDLNAGACDELLDVAKAGSSA